MCLCKTHGRALFFPHVSLDPSCYTAGQSCLILHRFKSQGFEKDSASIIKYAYPRPPISSAICVFVCVCVCVCVCVREMERENVLTQRQYDLTIACLKISYHLCSLCSTFLHKQVQNIASYLSVDLVRKISQFTCVL